MNHKSSALTAGRLRPQPQILRPATNSVAETGRHTVLATAFRFCRTAFAETASFTQAHIRTDRVAAIRCNYCGTWVKPRRYDPRYNACTVCLPAVQADRRAQIRAHERELGLI